MFGCFTCFYSLKYPHLFKKNISYVCVDISLQKIPWFCGEGWLQSNIRTCSPEQNLLSFTNLRILE